MDLLKTQLPQLIISVLLIIGIFLLLALGVITTDDPVFAFGGGGILAIIVGYWLSVGQQRLQHAHMMEAIKTSQEEGSEPTKLTTKPMVRDWNKCPDGK